VISRGPAPGPSPASRALARAAARRVLIVDDAQAVRSRLRRLLEQLGYRRIYEAANGRDAIAAGQADTRHYAKRQFTWFRHQLPEFAWIAPESAAAAVRAALASAGRDDLA